MIKLILIIFGLWTLSGAEPEIGSGVRRQNGTELGDEITNILNSLREGYDKRVRPNFGGEPVKVGLTMFILSISSVSEVQMDFTVDFYFRQMWTDPRLKFKAPEGIDTISVSSEFLRTLWMPDTFFANEKKSYFHTATVNNEFLRISKDGEVLRSIRLTITPSCPMDLRYFPMDSQSCSIEIESYGYTMADIDYRWAKGVKSVGISSDVSLPQFKVLGHKITKREEALSTGNYSRLACEIQFVRSLGYYLIQIYVPAGLIVIVSWTSFWLKRNASPARTALGITTVLTMTTLMTSTNAALPKVSYVKSIDVYLGTCFVMVFAALLEFASVSYTDKRIEMQQKEQEKSGKISNSLNRAGAEGKEGNDLEAAHPFIPGKGKVVDVNKWHGISAADIDKYSRVTFPIFFACFQILYWSVYLHISDFVVDDLVILE